MANNPKNPFLPPYNPKKLYSIFVSVFIISIIPLTILGVHFQQSLEKLLLQTSQKELNNLSVKVASLKTGTVLNGVEDIQVKAQDNDTTVASVSLLVNGENIGTMNNLTSSNEFTPTIAFDTTKFKNGDFTLTAIAKTASGLSLASIPVKVTVQNTDSQVPSIDFVTLEDGGFLPQKTQAVNLNVTDNLGVAKVSLYLDNQLVKEFSSAPYNYTWSVANLVPGNHIIKAVAQDFVGNQKTAQISAYKPTSTSKFE